MLRRSLLILLCVVAAGAAGPAEAGEGREYKLLATRKTSTMEKELNEAAAQGYRFEGVMGGETAFGGNETVVIMSRDPREAETGRYGYRLLATNKTSTMQKELQEAGLEGYEYKGQTVFDTSFGGREVVVILERDRQAKAAAFEYKLLATQRTSTMQKEIDEAAREGFHFVGITVAQTAFGGKEVVVITRRPRG